MVATVLLLHPLTLARAQPVQQPQIQTDGDHAQQAQQLFAQMSPAERVGQLFIITFNGIDTGPESDVYDLIANHHIGGVVLKAENNNITGNTINEDSVPQQVLNLTNTLQEIALTGRATTTANNDDTLSDQATPLPVATPTAGPLPPPRISIPLFVSTTHIGNDPANIIGGLTEIPSQMAIGATWDPVQAEAVGGIIGRELQILGINMLFGPALDLISDVPQDQMAAQLNTHVFGSDPYWVSKMGTAYVSGIKNGSNGRLAIIATHFPGIGNSDRPSYSEVSTVRRSAIELQEKELVPFTAVTGAETAVDGLLTAHIRYQGLQGNILPNTAPFSFDPQAIETLLQTPPLTEWRTNGGLLVSDALGVQAIELFYDSGRQEFPHRQVAKDALLAGNDLLYAAEFALGEKDFALQNDNIRDTLLWFQEKYATDPAFQMRVDQAVLRILELKLKLYAGDFSLENIVQADTSELTTLNQDTGTTFNLAQSALTLLAPTAEELLERLPGPPGADDNIVIFTDIKQTQQCTTCGAEPIISQTTIEERVLALYGPAGSGQIQPQQLNSFSMADLQEFLTNDPPFTLPTPTPELPTPTANPNVTPSDEVVLPTPSPTPSTTELVQQAIFEADWVIFSILDVEPGTPAAALHDILAQRPDLLNGKRIIVYAFGAPIYLDATEVSKVSAYFGIYSTGESFIDAAVQALFRDLPLRGASPISIPSVGYDLQVVTEPNPTQIIPLTLQNDELEETLFGENQDPLSLRPGATLQLATGIIYDRNGRPVPDGTIVQFIQQDRIQGFFNVIAEIPTQDGIASYDYVLEARTGQFRLRVTAGEAAASEVVDIAIGEEVSIIVASPTPEPTSTPTPPPTITPSPIPTFTSTPTPLPIEPETIEPTYRLDFSLAQLQMLGAMLAGLLTIAFVSTTLTSAHPQIRLNLLLWGLLGALLVYNYFALDLPQSEQLYIFGIWAGLITTLVGGLSGIILRLISQYIQNRLS